MSKPSFFCLVAQHFQGVGVQPDFCTAAQRVLHNYLISRRCLEDLTGFWASVGVPHEGCLALCSDFQDALGSPRVIQFSKAIPMRASARSGWAAKRRHAAAMLA